uniref:Uncharacterized protein n=1 Tax=Oryza brachyantha TaxID=4533 RepID=J3MA92_ORYBR
MIKLKDPNEFDPKIVASLQQDATGVDSQSYAAASDPKGSSSALPVSYHDKTGFQKKTDDKTKGATDDLTNEETTSENIMLPRETLNSDQNKSPRYSVGNRA